MYICISVFAYLNVSVHVYTHTHTYVQIYTYMLVCVCMCLWVYIYIHNVYVLKEMGLARGVNTDQSRHELSEISKRRPQIVSILNNGESAFKARNRSRFPSRAWRYGPGSKLIRYVPCCKATRLYKRLSHCLPPPLSGGGVGSQIAPWHSRVQ